MFGKNIIDFELPNGLKRIEICCADILEIQETIDILVVSAFQNDYLPVPDTLIGGLYTKGVSVEWLAKEPDIDMRAMQHVWLSKALEKETVPYKRIACIELSPYIGTLLDIDIVKKRIAALFGMLAAAQYSGVSVKNVVMSIIGANSQKYDAGKMVELILTEGYRALELIPDFSCFKIVVRNRDHFKKLNDAFNKILGRTKSDIVAEDLYETTKMKVLQMQKDFLALKGLRNNINKDDVEFNDVINSFESIESDPRYIVAFKCRRLAELVAKDLLMMSGLQTNGILVNNIDKVCQQYSIPKWINSYWHIIRIFGNEGAHIKEFIEEHKNVMYHHPNHDDINILLLCSAELLHTWRKIREKGIRKDSYNKKPMCCL